MCYYVKDGVLMRKWRDMECPANEPWKGIHQVVLPLGIEKRLCNSLMICLCQVTWE